MALVALFGLIEREKMGKVSLKNGQRRKYFPSQMENIRFTQARHVLPQMWLFLAAIKR